MIRTVVTPETVNLQLNVSIPQNYVGKKVEILLYVSDEVKEEPAHLKKKLKPSDYAGILSTKDAEVLLKHVEKSRNDRERNI